jgi:hypothetical protein
MEETMPYTTTKLPSGKVEVTSPHGIKSKGSTPANAEKQIHLLRAVEHSNWRPTHNQNAMSKRLGGS